MESIIIVLAVVLLALTGILWMQKGLISALEQRITLIEENRAKWVATAQSLAAERNHAQDEVESLKNKLRKLNHDI